MFCWVIDRLTKSLCRTQTTNPIHFLVFCLLNPLFGTPAPGINKLNSPSLTPSPLAVSRLPRKRRCHANSANKVSCFQIRRWLMLLSLSDTLSWATQMTWLTLPHQVGVLYKVNRVVILRSLNYILSGVNGLYAGLISFICEKAVKVGSFWFVSLGFLLH